MRLLSFFSCPDVQGGSPQFHALETFWWYSLWRFCAWKWLHFWCPQWQSDKATGLIHNSVCVLNGECKYVIPLEFKYLKQHQIYIWQHWKIWSSLLDFKKNHFYSSTVKAEGRKKKDKQKRQPTREQKRNVKFMIFHGRDSTVIRLSLKFKAPQERRQTEKKVSSQLFLLLIFFLMFHIKRRVQVTKLKFSPLLYFSNVTN